MSYSNVVIQDISLGKKACIRYDLRISSPSFLEKIFFSHLSQKLILISDFILVLFFHKTKMKEKLNRSIYKVTVRRTG